MKSESKPERFICTATIAALLLCSTWQTGLNAATNATLAAPPAPPSAPASDFNNYFYVTAYDSTGHESVPSNTVVSSNLPVSLAWNASPTLTVSGYSLYWSQDGTTFQRVSDSGTNTAIQWPVVLTNRVVSFSMSWTMTNPSTAMFFRVMASTNLQQWFDLPNQKKSMTVTPF